MCAGVAIKSADEVIFAIFINSVATGDPQFGLAFYDSSAGSIGIKIADASSHFMTNTFDIESWEEYPFKVFIDGNFMYFGGMSDKYSTPS